MKVLITNDDGFFARGLKALARRIGENHDTFIVAPQTEQSGISQAITFLRPLNPNRVYNKQNQCTGYSVNGTPVDCVKLGIHELAPWKPDLIVSGINFGLNIGINVCHSGTAGGAFAGSMFGIPSVAVSVEGTEHANFDLAAEIALSIIEKIDWVKLPAKSVVNINIPRQVKSADVTPVFVPVETNPLGYHFQKGTDPKQRHYFWATNEPAPEPSPVLTDAQAAIAGHVTVSTLAYDPNHPTALDALASQFESNTLPKP
jgi:5'-nucleotidase